ncbi:MAG: hypothetical protein JW947_09610 [Sedimentisphaerales bacterium]|nr:hypothetical protein [Sedimentisphaerales bacterium]
MENFDINKTPPDRNLNNEPIPFDNNAGGAGISHSPLNLGGGAAAAPKIEKPAQPVSLTAKKPAENTVSGERITGVKTFFTKLHAGAIEFMDEIITKWLKENPGISIKRTNIITGEIQGKKTEPNIIITVWY